MSPREITWHIDRWGEARCPVCKFEGRTRLFLEIDSTANRDERVTFAKCPNCGTLYQIDFQSPDYETYHLPPAALKFYLEQGAGLETLVLPACIAKQRQARLYLEIGCGFGFGLDFARSSFGLSVRGMDPSPIADAGANILRLPIEHRYLSGAALDGREVYDTIGALEVIEHIESPGDILPLLRQKLAPEGLLILSTPDAEYIEFAKEKPSMLSVLTPGYHSTIYTQASLRLALEQAGFADIAVVAQGATLLAVAGLHASSVDFTTAFQRPAYEDYLIWRAENYHGCNPLKIGLLYRRFKLLVNEASYEGAEAVLRNLAGFVREYDGIDLTNPHGLLSSDLFTLDFEPFVERYPACIGGILFFSGLLHLNYHGNRAVALSYFYVAHLVTTHFRRVMQDFGIDDGETAVFQRKSIEHISLVAGWVADG